MSVTSKLERVLDMLEGHEEEVARTVSKRTSVSQEQIETVLRKVQETVNSKTD